MKYCRMLADVIVAKRLTTKGGWCATKPRGFVSGNCSCRFQSRLPGSVFASAAESGRSRRYSSDRGAVKLVGRCKGNSSLLESKGYGST